MCSLAYQQSQLFLVIVLTDIHIFLTFRVSMYCVSLARAVGLIRQKQTADEVSFVDASLQR